MKTNKKIIHKEKDYITLIVFFCMFFILILLIVSNIRIYQKRVSIEEYLNEKKEELMMLEKKAKENLSIDPSEEFYNIEKVAREQFLFKKPGEEVVIIKYPEIEEEDIKKEEIDVPWWKKIFMRD